MTLTKTEVAVLHQKQVESGGPAVERLRTRLSGVSEIQLDDPIGSLLPLNEWFLTEITSSPEDTGAGLPVWWDPKVAMVDASEETSNPFTLGQLQLIDQMQAYVSEVARHAYPMAKWMIYKGSKRDFKNGETMLQLREKFPFSARSYVYGESLDVVLYAREVEPGLLVEVLERAIKE